MLTACSIRPTPAPTATVPLPTATRLPIHTPPPTATNTAVPPTATVTPEPTALPSTATPIPDEVVFAAGDIASCVSYGARATSDLIVDQPGTVLTMGDNAYDSGTPEEFANCYNPTWGRFKDRTYPSLGNHDYVTYGASAYFSYFGVSSGDPGKGYYSFDLGAWHLIALNSNCTAVEGCKAGSPQEQWLRADLAAHPNLCTLAYFHHPLFNAGFHGPYAPAQDLWQALYEGQADLVLNGHDHNYQRFAPQDPQGQADPDHGLREFIVGTGGASHYPVIAKLPNLEAFNANTFGVLRLVLHPDGYDFTFLPEANKTFTDSGSGKCH